MYIVALLVGLYVSAVLSLAITGPDMGVYITTITVTWTTAAGDPQPYFYLFMFPIISGSVSTDDNYVSVTPDTDALSLTGNPVALVGLYSLEAYSYMVDEKHANLSNHHIQIVAPASSLSGSSTTNSPSSTAQSSTAPSSTQSTSSSSPPSSGLHHSNIGAIAGRVVGGVIVIILALLRLWCVRRKAGNDQEQITINQPQVLTPHNESLHPSEAQLSLT
ncbi:hypothetical protein B0H19DRAFT_1271405 [Mycena capillaripes]|nr:hypothetical protein B0H19DRAFT_1271405 [Mycena capillaripes]